jgi:hypothetical protein
MRRALVVWAILAVCAGAGLEAQWIKFRTPGLPRLPDGSPDLAAPAPRTPDGKPDFSGVWRNDGGDRYYNNIAVELTAADIAPWARALFTKRSLEFGKDGMETLCLPLGPAYLTTRYREYRIVQTPTLVVFAYDDGMHREIFIDGRSLEPDPNPSWMGYSVGRWEGDTLIVESNGYTDRSWLDFGGHPHTEQLRITERYTRSSVGRMSVQVTMVDPTIFAKPITLTMPVKLTVDTEMLEGFCENHHASRERMASTRAAEVVQVPVATLSGYVGVYDMVDDPAKRIVRISVDGPDLWLDYDGAGRELLVALSPLRFSWSGAIVEFSPASGGGMNIVILTVEGAERFVRRN